MLVFKPHKWPLNPIGRLFPRADPAHYPPDPNEPRILDEQTGDPITDEQADDALLEE